MPPKALPKARQGALRRPAAKVRERKKPSTVLARVPGEPGPERDVKKFAEVRAQDLLKLGPIILQDARYYGRTVHIAGHVVDIQSESGHLYAILKVTGTKDEDLLRVLSGRTPRHLRVHLCDEDCSQLVTDELLVHSRTFEAVELSRLPWLTCLEEVGPGVQAVDEMAKLREEQERQAAVAQAGLEERGKQKKRKKEVARGDEGRVPNSPKPPRDDKEPGQKDLSLLFSGTGMGPDVRQRKKLLRKAQKLGKKKSKRKKKKEEATSSSSHGSSSSSSTSLDSHAEGLFDEELRLRQIWRKFPGVLTARALSEARHALITSAGTVWDVDKSALPPLFLQYARAQLLGSMGPVVAQECLTLCMTLDCLVQGNVCKGMDVLAQRVKALESISRGGHWSVARQLELVSTELQGMSEQGESLAAARAAREQERLRSMVSRAPTSRGGDFSQGGKTRKGKDKGTGKGAANEGGGKSKGGNPGKEEGKATWQKKEK
eukprot:s185_g16.t1